MSLIYNTLREQAPALPARLPVRKLRRPAALLLAVLVAVPTGYAGVRLVTPATGQHREAALSDTATTGPALVQPLPLRHVAVRQPQPAPVPTAGAAAAPVVSLPDPVRTTAVATAASVTAPIPPSTPSVVAQGRVIAPGIPPAAISSAMRPAGDLQISQRQADRDGIATLQAQLQQAIAERQFEHAQDLLVSLAEQLPADSLTLLRAQAWLAHARGDQAMAMQAYRRIVERVPDDAHAGANLALLLAAAGQTQQAHAALARLSVQQADNPLLLRARAALEATAP